MVKYEVRNIDSEGEPIIATGETNFYRDDRELVPEGYCFNMSQSTPGLITIYANEDPA